jgi:eukaryotic-like serine/threonine-protein kinase
MKGVSRQRTPGIAPRPPCNGYSRPMTDQITRLNAALQGRFFIESRLGEGGMATVYLAKDIRHNRRVALKVPNHDLAVAVGADRFLLEIETTAALQHPHILPLLDSGEADGLLFYTMPYIEGETLQQRMGRDARLPIDEALSITHDVADALQVAHEAGVTHRDIKPSNILLSRGRALVMDFGIARMAALAANKRLTQTGASLGTIGYMSPEQAAGDAGVDLRADIYSLGCVLFEMLVGETPFAGDSLVQVIAKQVTGSVPAVRDRRPEVPPAVDQAVSRCLHQDPDQRFQTSDAFLEALLSKGGEAVSAPPVGRTLVVLPFVNRSADADNEYFSDGLTDEVISDLASVSALRVISRTSAMALKGTTKDTKTLARELGVTHLVSGTVRRAGNALRITVDLVEASTDSPIWSEKLSGTMDDVFGIQEEISRKIVSALKVRLTDTEEQGVAHRPIENPVAFECYLRARHLMYNWTPEAQSRAVRLVDEALGIMGDSPLLLAVKGQLHWNLVNANMGSGEDGLARAADFADRALAIDPDSYLAVFVRGLVACTRGRPEEGLRDLLRAHELRPGDTNVLTELVRFSHSAGRRHHWKEVDLLARTDPLSPQASVLLASYYWMHGPQAEACPAARRSMELAPDPSFLHTLSAWILAAGGQPEEAVEILERIAPAISDRVISSLSRFLACALVDDHEGASLAATEEMERGVTNEYILRILADGHALLGQTDDACRVLRKAMNFGFTNYPALTAQAPFLKGLRDDPDFELLLEEVRVRWNKVVGWEQRGSAATRD